MKYFVLKIEINMLNSTMECSSGNTSFLSYSLLRYAGLWWWYINIIITTLDIIHLLYYV
jgi:hypothetical protein